jgi:transposase
VLGFLQTIRMRYPTRQRIHLVMDNLSTHWTPDIRAWAAETNVELVLTPTYASFLNRIECHLRNRTHGGGPIATIEARRRVA